MTAKSSSTDQNQPADDMPAPAPTVAAGAPLTLLGRDAILGQQDTRYAIVYVRAWGNQPVRIKSLSAKEREEFEQSISTTDAEGKTRTNLITARAKLCVRTLVDAKGGKIFDDSFVGALSEKSADAVGQIFEESSKLSGIMKRDVEDLVGNSKPGPIATSS